MTEAMMPYCQEIPHLYKIVKMQYDEGMFVCKRASKCIRKVAELQSNLANELEKLVEMESKKMQKANYQDRMPTTWMAYRGFHAQLNKLATIQKQVASDMKEAADLHLEDFMARQGKLQQDSATGEDAVREMSKLQDELSKSRTIAAKALNELDQAQLKHEHDLQAKGYMAERSIKTAITAPHRKKALAACVNYENCLKRVNAKSMTYRAPMQARLLELQTAEESRAAVMRTCFNMYTENLVNYGTNVRGLATSFKAIVAQVNPRQDILDFTRACAEMCGYSPTIYLKSVRYDLDVTPEQLRVPASGHIPFPRTQLFGASLESMIKYEQETFQKELKVPLLLETLLAALLIKGVVNRATTSTATWADIKKLQKQVEKGKYDFSHASLEACSGLIKEWLRMLEGGLIHQRYYQEVLTYSDDAHDSPRLVQLMDRINSSHNKYTLAVVKRFAEFLEVAAREHGRDVCIDLTLEFAPFFFSPMDIRNEISQMAEAAARINDAAKLSKFFGKFCVYILKRNFVDIDGNQTNNLKQEIMRADQEMAQELKHLEERNNGTGLSDAMMEALHLNTSTAQSTDGSTALASSNGSAQGSSKTPNILDALKAGEGEERRVSLVPFANMFGTGQGEDNTATPDRNMATMLNNSMLASAQPSRRGSFNYEHAQLVNSSSRSTAIPLSSAFTPGLQPGATSHLATQTPATHAFRMQRGEPYTAMHRGGMTNSQVWRMSTTLAEEKEKNKTPLLARRRRLDPRTGKVVGEKLSNPEWKETKEMKARRQKLKMTSIQRRQLSHDFAVGKIPMNFGHSGVHAPPTASRLRSNDYTAPSTPMSVQRLPELPSTPAYLSKFQAMMSEAQRQALAQKDNKKEAKTAVPGEVEQEGEQWKPAQDEAPMLSAKEAEEEEKQEEGQPNNGVTPKKPKAALGMALSTPKALKKVFSAPTTPDMPAPPASAAQIYESPVHEQSELVRNMIEAETPQASASPREQKQEQEEKKDETQGPPAVNTALTAAHTEHTAQTLELSSNAQDGPTNHEEIDPQASGFALSAVFSASSSALASHKTATHTGFRKPSANVAKKPLTLRQTSWKGTIGRKPKPNLEASKAMLSKAAALQARAHGLGKPAEKQKRPARGGAAQVFTAPETPLMPPPPKSFSPYHEQENAQTDLVRHMIEVESQYPTEDRVSRRGTLAGWSRQESVRSGPVGEGSLIDEMPRTDQLADMAETAETTGGTDEGVPTAQVNESQALDAALQTNHPDQENPAAGDTEIDLNSPAEPQDGYMQREGEYELEVFAEGAEHVDEEEVDLFGEVGDDLLTIPTYKMEQNEGELFVARPASEEVSSQEEIDPGAVGEAGETMIGEESINHFMDADEEEADLFGNADEEGVEVVQDTDADLPAVESAEEGPAAVQPPEKFSERRNSNFMHLVRKFSYSANGGGA